MSCVIERETVRILPFRKAGLWHKLSRVFRSGRNERSLRLDPCELSDHLKRDLGFLDGRC